MIIMLKTTIFLQSVFDHFFIDLQFFSFSLNHPLLHESAHRQANTITMRDKHKRKLNFKAPAGFETLLNELWRQTTISNPKNIPVYLKNFFQDKLIEQEIKIREKFEIEQAEKAEQNRSETLKTKAALLIENLIINSEKILAKELHERIKLENAKIAEKAEKLRLEKIRLEIAEKEAQEKRILLERQREEAKRKLIEKQELAKVQREKIIKEQTEIARLEAEAREAKLQQLLDKLSEDAILEEDSILREQEERELEGEEVHRRVTQIKKHEEEVEEGLQLEYEKMDKNKQEKVELKLAEDRCKLKHDGDKAKREEQAYLAENRERLAREARLKEKREMTSREIKDKNEMKLDKINQIN